MYPNTHRPALIERASAASPDHIDEELRRYDEHLRDVRGLSSGSRRSCLRVAGRLLRQKFGSKVVDISRLRPADVRQFLADQLDARRTPSNASTLASGLRGYLRYRSACGDPVDALAAVISSPAHWRLAPLPHALTAEEVEQLLESFRFVRRWPKRGYAIVRCALDLGLRAGEIARLTISDIDWRTGTVTLRGTKSFRQDLLPLPVDTGQALADYLQHERPPTPNPAIFVRRLGSRDQPITSGAVQKVITRAFRRSGLPRSGSHALRHTLACRLVEQGSSLKEVADLLRHRSLNTTLIYAKLDTPKLSTVPLPWPGSES
jgi:integrase